MGRHAARIGEHGFLSDCHTAALTTPDGTIDWMCVPRFDGAALLSGILDPRGGGWTMEVEGAGPQGRAYVDDTLVLETLWRGTDVEVAVRDLLAVGRRGRSGLRREGVLLRVVECRSGGAAVRSRLDARPDFGRAAPEWERLDGALRETSSGVLLSGTHTPGLAEDGVPEYRVELAEGDTAVFALDYLDGGRRVGAGEASRLVRETLEAWRDWAGRTDYQGVGAAQVRRSALTLRGLLYEETGALVAAPTTSLPEWPGGPRNWDYRYVWHRDAALVVLAFLRLGHSEEAGNYLRFLLGMCGNPIGWIPPVQAVDDAPPPREEVLDHLAGYDGSRPVRVGNGAHAQHQLDVYGHILDAALSYEEATGRLRREDLEQLTSVVESVRKLWREPDEGIWEARSEPRHWTHSKVYAWVCLDRGIRLLSASDKGKGVDAPLDEWRREMEDVREEVLDRGYDPGTGSFTQSYGSTNVDGSLLRIPLLGFLEGTDPRVLGTLERVDHRLGVDGCLVRRYDTERTDDGIGTPEGAFLLCSFDMVSALVLAGRAGEARERFEELCARSGDLGLHAEEMAADGTMLGNFPQAFTHLALIEAAVNLDSATDREALHDWVRSRSGVRTERRRRDRDDG